MLVKKWKAGILSNRDDLEDTADLERWLQNADKKKKTNKEMIRGAGPGFV